MKIESVTNIPVGSRIVRVWRKETELKDGYANADISSTVRTALRGNFLALTKVIESLKGVTAYEILDSKGHGVKVTL